MDKHTYQDGACIKTSCNHVHAWSPNTRCTSNLESVESSPSHPADAHMVELTLLSQHPDLATHSSMLPTHPQVFFSRANPLFVAGLPFFQRLWYCYASW